MTGKAEARPQWLIQVHGGAGVLERESMTPERDAETRAALREALEAGGAVLDDGGSALDAVEAAVRVLEDDPHFNAGKGAVFTADGRNELDASIMDGATRQAGAVAGVTRTRHPVTLARAVLEKSPHVLLMGEGADQFSAEAGVEQVDPSYFRTEERWRQLEKMRAREAAGEQAGVFDKEVKYGTVGAVAMDREGHLAAATSTGGLTGKSHGRVGDSPLIGAGTYADDRACAVSATGSGEFYIREGVAHEICARVRFLGEDAQAAADAVQAETRALGGDGGVIVIDKDGGAAFSFNTPGMYRGRLVAGAEAMVGIYGDE
ncbi:isoaspartyl peptidase/L-asparaginase [Novosphingobium sp. PC22D]|uniref:isoaspartyl peptidase/L-asparaginase family protein n=1 Tax=Novosphingobium sp. PC22D TaxID=1962403 RepID=UPI000BF027E2|nr:isoaspartyl peptidase/L-asparaginase [Novosphingobium sp. PC22D]PEQ11870.1 isoaspartyl peptidase/L-asparaginase [Novosphingobium sp. PC22D]